MAFVNHFSMMGSCGGACTSRPAAMTVTPSEEESGWPANTRGTHRAPGLPRGSSSDDRLSPCDAGPGVAEACSPALRCARGRRDRGPRRRVARRHPGHADHSGDGRVGARRRTRLRVRTRSRACRSRRRAPTRRPGDPRRRFLADPGDRGDARRGPRCRQCDGVGRSRPGRARACARGGPAPAVGPPVGGSFTTRRRTESSGARSGLRSRWPGAGGRPSSRWIIHDPRPA
jgi:hypothetical protein